MENQRERERLSYNASPFATATNMASNKLAFETPWPLMANPNNSLDDMRSHTPDFVCPSYLRNSRYVQRLAEEHRTAVAAASESQRQAKHHVYYGKDNPSSAAVSASSSGVNLPRLSAGLARTPVQDPDHSFRPDDRLAKLPSCWSDTDKCSGLELLNDGSEVRFQGQTKTNDEAAAIRSDHPMPKEVGLFYFEVTILSRGKEGYVLQLVL